MATSSAWNKLSLLHPRTIGALYRRKVCGESGPRGGGAWPTAALHRPDGLMGSGSPRIRLTGRNRRSSGINSCRLPGTVRLGLLVRCTRWRILVLSISDRFEGSMMETVTPERWSLKACVRRLPDCHRQGRATMTHHRLVLTAVAVFRWCRNLDVIFIMFKMLRKDITAWIR